MKDSPYITKPTPMGTLDGYAVTEYGAWVTLTCRERQYAWQIAKERDRKAIAANADPDRHAIAGLGLHEMEPMDSQIRNYIGCLGEMAFARWANIEWTGARKSWAEDDDVCGYEIRSTRYINGALRIWEKDDGCFTLAVVYRDGIVRIAGWRTADSLRVDGRVWDGGVRWCTQRELWAIDDLPLPALEAAEAPRTATSPRAGLSSVASSAALLSSEPQPSATSGGSAHGTRGVESRPQPLRRGSSGVAALTFMEAE